MCGFIFSFLKKCLSFGLKIPFLFPKFPFNWPQFFLYLLQKIPFHWALKFHSFAKNIPFILKNIPFIFQKIPFICPKIPFFFLSPKSLYLATKIPFSFQKHFLFTVFSCPKILFIKKKKSPFSSPNFLLFGPLPSRFWGGKTFPRLFLGSSKSVCGAL